MGILVTSIFMFFTIAMVVGMAVFLRPRIVVIHSHKSELPDKSKFRIS